MKLLSVSKYGSVTKSVWSFKSGFISRIRFLITGRLYVVENGMVSDKAIFLDDPFR